MITSSDAVAYRTDFYRGVSILEDNPWICNSTSRPTIIMECFPMNLPPGFLHSVRRNPSPNCPHRRRSLAMAKQDPLQVPDKVVSSSCLRSSLSSCLFSWCPLFHSYSTLCCLWIVQCVPPIHVFPSILIWCHFTVWYRYRIQVLYYVCGHVHAEHSTLHVVLCDWQ